jgi:hypothetical protein
VLSICSGGAHEHDRDAELLSGPPGTGHDLARRVVATHGVHGDREASGGRRLGPRPRRDH